MTSTTRSGATELHRDLSLRSCIACDGVAEVTGTFRLPGPDGDEDYLRTRCLDGHLVVVPAFVHEQR